MKEGQHRWCLQGSARLLRGCWLAGGAYLAWRLSVGSIRRLSRMAGHNRKLKRELLNVWKGIEVRTGSFPTAWESCALFLPAQPQVPSSSAVLRCYKRVDSMAL